MKLPFFRSPYNYDTALASDEAAIPPGSQGESLTIQSHSEDADINVLMRRFRVTGQLPQSITLPEYGDFTQITDYRTALHAVMDAQDQFSKLPADLRSRYSNDPQQFLEAVYSGEALQPLKDAGLLGVATNPPPVPSGPVGASGDGSAGTPPATTTPGS